MKAQELDLVDLYSCFPLAVQTYASALGLALSRDLSVTGGMPFAGGPYNNYVLQATCRAAELLRLGRGRNALVSSVSGTLTKQGFGLWCAEPPARGFSSADLSGAVAREMPTREVADNYSGAARIAGYTVLHGRAQTPRGIALADTEQGQRALVCTEDASLIARMQQEEFVGRPIRIEDNGWVA